MHIILTVSSAVILCACLWALWRCWAAVDPVTEAERTCIQVAANLRAERDRVTTNERELDALRRELRKLSGKFYAQQREIIETVATEQPDGSREHVPVSLFCPNYGLAQKDGPTSKAAQCDCGYCSEMRERKAAFRERQRAAGHLNPQWVRAHSTGTGNHGE